MILHQDPNKRPKEGAKAIVIHTDYMGKGIRILKGSYLLECVDGFFQLHYDNGTRSHLRLHPDWLYKLKDHVKK